jgi:soluble lytic murein transglycosylase-like protein
MDFLGFAGQCGPDVHPVTTTAIVKAESGFRPLAVRNNTTKQSFYSTDHAEAKQLVEGFTAKGDRLAIGLMQVTTPWAVRFGIAPADLLDSCTNVRIGTAILRFNFDSCVRANRTQQATLECALSAYWSGNGQIGGAYVNHVYTVAGSANRVTETAGVTDGVLNSKASAKAGVNRPVPGFDAVPTSAGSVEFTPRSDGFSFR